MSYIKLNENKLYGFHIYVNDIYVGLVCDATLGEITPRGNLIILGANGLASFVISCKEYKTTITDNEAYVDIYITK